LDISEEVGQRVKKFRKERGLSQEKLAEKLDVSRPVVSQIEKGKRKIKVEDVFKLAEILDFSIEELIGTKDPIKVEIESESSQESAGEDSENKPRVRVPQGKVEKFKEVLLYIFNEVGSKPNVGQSVIYKLLYFIDFDFYEKWEEQLMGATYIKNHYGPTPVEFKKIVDGMIENEEIEEVESEYFDYPQTKYLPREEPDLSKFDGREIEMINNVLEKLSDKTATQLSNYSHNDVPWITAEEGEEIEYEAVFYRTPEYSVRSYDEEEES